MLRLISIQAIREIVNSNIAPKNAFVPLKQAFKKLDDPVVKKAWRPNYPTDCWGLQRDP